MDKYKARARESTLWFAGVSFVKTQCCPQAADNHGINIILISIKHTIRHLIFDRTRLVKMTNKILKNTLPIGPPTRKKIKLGQVKHLLRVYHGKQQVDLGSNIQTDASRQKGFFRRNIPFLASSPIVKNIEILIREIESSGLQENDDISGDYERRLINLIEKGEQLDPCATQLLCKKIAAIMRLGMQHVISYQSNKIHAAGFCGAIAGVIRLGSEFSPAVTFMFCALAIILMTHLTIKTATAKALAFFQAAKTKKPVTLYNQNVLLNELDESHYLKQQCRKYAEQLGMQEPPRLFMEEVGLNASAFPYSLPDAKNGFIVISKGVMDTFDKEQVGAFLAHEMGHIFDLLPQQRKCLIEGLNIAIPAITAFSFQLLSVLFQYATGSNNSYCTNIINWLVMLAATMVLSNQKALSREKYADDIAVKLVGPLSVSSWMRQVNLILHSRPAPSPTRVSEMLLALLGVGELFSSHPAEVDRMQI